MYLIYVIKKGKEKFEKNKIKRIIYDLKFEGAEYIILGCTELPLAVKLLNIEGNFIDPTNILARLTVNKSLEID